MNADTMAPAGYVVIFRFGRTEVESIQRHDTWVSALAEASCAADEGADEAWIESTAKAGS